MTSGPTFALNVAHPATSATPFAEVALYSDIAAAGRQGLKLTLPQVAALHVDNESGAALVVQPAAGPTRWTYLLGPFESLDLSCPAAPFDNVVLLDPSQTGFGLPVLPALVNTPIPQETALGPGAATAPFVLVSGSDVPCSAARSRHMPDRLGAVQLLSETFQSTLPWTSPALYVPGAHELILDLNVRSLAGGATLTPYVYRKSLIGVFPIVEIPAWTGAGITAAGASTYCLDASSVGFWDEAIISINATGAATFDVAVGVR